MNTGPDLLADLIQERKVLQAEQRQLQSRLPWIETRLAQLDSVEDYLRERSKTASVSPTVKENVQKDPPAGKGVEKRKVFEALRESKESLPPKVIADRKQVVPSTVRNTLRKAETNGEATSKDGKYKLTNIGVAWLDGEGTAS